MPIIIPIIEGEVYCDGMICVSAYKNIEKRKACPDRNTGMLCGGKMRDVYKDEVDVEIESYPDLNVNIHRKIRLVRSEGSFEVLFNYSVHWDKDDGMLTGSISSFMERTDTLDEAIALVDTMTDQVKVRAVRSRKAGI